MSSLQIVTFPHPALKEVAAPVERFDDELRELVAQMRPLMHEHDGVGLAATQVGVPQQLLLLSSYVFLSPEERKAASEDPTWEGEDLVVINPKVMSQSEEMELDYEGCLSFPEVYIKVRRPKWVKIEALNLEGERVELEGEGFGARAILHEMDHLTGKVMTDHLSYLARQSALKKHQRIQKALKKEAAEAPESTEASEGAQARPKLAGARPSHAKAGGAKKAGAKKAARKKR